ncbi:hypothetical protein BB559_000299 [Furculomyces boomerangus]|uniref:Histone-lysine N-methyltransferase n=1 Tax=Furculomyces boomerangus TaxID=61424 RepID=A0A2T9Z5V3_9FUNG|nr:hypothetical protein BB559_000299 [Furculomyces boomerangus]
MDKSQKDIKNEHTVYNKLENTEYNVDFSGASILEKLLGSVKTVEILSDTNSETTEDQESPKEDQQLSKKPSLPQSLPPPISENLLQFHILVKNCKGPPITVVNLVDDAHAPIDFEFINESRYAPDVPRPQQLQVKPCMCQTEELQTRESVGLINKNLMKGDFRGIEQVEDKMNMNASSIFSGYTQESFKKIVNRGCKPLLSDHEETSHICVHDADVGCAYNSSGLLQLPEKSAIYECNWMCPCGPSCYNRLIQRGPQVLLQIFRTENKGWGVRTLETLQKGQFVAEYVGEIITYTEAERRGKLNDELGSTYLFDLDFETQEDMNTEFTIDAEKCGNITHFLNHSCSPNLQIRAAYINHCDSRLHQLAFFTKDRIPAGTELTFDYNPSAPFPGDKGYVDFTDSEATKTPFSFRSPNRSSRPGPNMSGVQEGVQFNGTENMDVDTTKMETPKKKKQQPAPYVHKGYKCYCGAGRCRGFVFLS